MQLRRGGTLLEPGGMCSYFIADKVKASIPDLVISTMAQYVLTAPRICSSHWTKAVKL